MRIQSKAAIQPELVPTETWESCAVCATSLSRHAMVRLGKAWLERCGSCGSWTYLPRPSPDEQAAIHDTGEYYEHPYFQARRQRERVVLRRCRQNFAVIGTALDLESLRGERLLDIGCDTGAFLRAAAALYGIVPVGIDVSRRAVAIARENGVEAYHAALESAPPELQNFRLITGIDLIEHVVNPRQFLRQLCKRLRPGGVAYVETPNIYSLVYRFGRVLCKLTGGRPRGIFERLFPAQHLQYFTEDGFEMAARRSGLELLHLGKRALPFSDVATSLPIGLAIAGLQMTDRMIRNQILLCALLRRPR